MTHVDSGTFVGTLDDDMTSLAAKISQRLLDGPLIVWVEGLDVYTGPREMTGIAVDWEIVGSYTPGESHHAILEDLQAVLRERANGDLLD
jgi:hypothetical protein